MGVGRGRILRRSASFFSSRWLAVSENSSREPASRENYYRKVLVAQAQASYVVQPDGWARGEREGYARRPWGASRRWSPAHGEVVDGGGRRFELKPLVHSQGRGDGGAMGAMRRALAAAGPWCNRWWPQNDIASPRARRCISNYS